MQALQTGLWSKSGPLATRARNPRRGHLKSRLIGRFARGPEIPILRQSVLVEEGLLTFDYGDERRSWDLNRMRAKGHTDNVVDLMVGKLNRLPVEID
jgi:hypothetical protein